MATKKGFWFDRSPRNPANYAEAVEPESYYPPAMKKQADELERKIIAARKTGGKEPARAPRAPQPD